MRKLVLLVCVTSAAVLVSLWPAASIGAQVIPSWEAPSGSIGFFPVSNEISLYRSIDDAGVDRGTTLQVVSINGFRLFTDFSFEFTADFNWDYTAGLARDHYIELGIVKPVGKLLCLNVQRVISTFEAESVNQIGVRLRL